MDQKLPLDVPRVRDVEADAEVSLAAYRALQTPKKTDEGLLLRVLKGISCRNYKACAESVPEAFGISASSVSRRFIKATAKKLKRNPDPPPAGYLELPGVRERWKFIDQVLQKSPLIKGVPMIGSLGCLYTCNFCIDSVVPHQPLGMDVIKEDLRFATA